MPGFSAIFAVCCSCSRNVADEIHGMNYVATAESMKVIVHTVGMKLL